MKKVIIAISLTAILIFCLVWLDIQNDKENILIVKKTSYAFDDWECGYRCTQTKFKVFEDERYNVERIRYGKDFMAIQIKSKNDILGWVILDESYEVINKK
ncbi:MAG: hypothetical protein U9R27_08735 [Campylobacterota bacterium]|nr:hypothetical protein [Campylobacterota bacterium]